MGRTWLKHGKWSRRMVWLHYYTIVSFGLLLASGIALFWPPMHTVLIPYLPFIYYVHIFLGLTFAITLLTPLLIRWEAAKRVRRLDWLFPVLFGVSIVVTGLLVCRQHWFPTTWSSIAFRWHGYVSYSFAAWILIHAVYKSLSYRPSPSGVNPRVNPDRRMFLKWLGAGTASTVIITVFEPIAQIGKLTANVSNSTASSISPGFPAFYTVTGSYPAVGESTYQLKIDGLVERPVSLSLGQVMALAHVHETADFHCVTGWSVANVKWEGVRVHSVANLVHPMPAAKFVHFYSLDGVYTESLSVADALDPTVMLAVRMNGQPLKTKQGYPLRLVVPKKYGYKSIKWVGRIAFSDKPLEGYWEERGYSNEAAITGGI
ncbi:molybdopterin-dependent oxidoreductase [Alicyclobacillus sp. SO9]|uniref:molybdopterin-dependent oxidoreductase n=1 Tax=Alicyclobacillus sp. SO9 TaxID=2665646 RepID=UPI0018E8585B|nr:molybdopterin-dependent oxidoreductase [Alicyclobacillus sp. SO9]QQE77064.1 molybdopterin-dependent oxidoreductase [Alicyclobacillus sp. SO9]